MYYVIAYCANNLGDDMFIQTLIRRYPDQIFHLRAIPKYVKHLKQEPNLHIDGKAKALICRVIQKVSMKCLNRIYGMEMARADAVIRIGGSIFIERPDSAEKYYPETNKNLFIMGANFGPYHSQTFFDTRKQRIRHAADCCFRDRYSFQLFSDIPTVRYAPDILFGYPFLPKPINGDHIGISVIDFSGRGGIGELRERYEKGLVSICDHWTGKGKTVLLFGFCIMEGDADAADRVYSACRQKSLVKRINYHGDIGSFLDEMNQCDILYATRFHAMILGWTMQKRVVPLIYSDKQRHVIDDIGFKGSVWDIQNEEIDVKVIGSEIKKLDSERLDRLKTGSESQFSAFDVFVEKKQS